MPIVVCIGERCFWLGFVLGMASMGRTVLVLNVEGLACSTFAMTTECGS